MKLTPKQLEQVARVLADVVYGDTSVAHLEVDAETLEAALYSINNARPSGLRARLATAIFIENDPRARSPSARPVRVVCTNTIEGFES